MEQSRARRGGCCEWLPASIDAVPLAGQATFGLALVAAAFLVASAFASARWIRFATLGTLAATLAAAIGFLATKPTGPAFGLAPGWSAIVFIAAVVSGALAAK